MSIDNDTLLGLTYGAPVVAALAGYAWYRRRVERANAATLAEAEAAGLTEAPSLHPVVDPGRCIGSGGCADACPEGALGIVGGKAALINPAVCIGHGACAAHCPVDAITLVFGSERRGIDIPAISPSFETDVPGLYIAGELGGMGLIRKAAEQGKQAIRAIAERRVAGMDYDVVIVGAGPAGIGAGLGAMQAKLRYALIEQEDSLGGTVLHYPRQKIAMTAPVDLPLVGKMRFTEVSKEKLLEFWTDIVERTQLQVRSGTRMEAIVATQGGFEVHTNRGVLRAGSVLLAIGRRGTPRKLGVPGEELSKVVYRLVDPAQYQGQRVLVVGGGDSAIEAALACAPHAEVILSYRGKAFNRIKPANRSYLDQAVAAGQLRVLLGSEVRRIAPQSVFIEVDGQEQQYVNDAVIVCAGGVLPTQMLKELGVRVETKYGTL